MAEIKCTPLVKWAGGKRQLLPEIYERMPKAYNKYYEPFFGGGALFFDLAPKNATINDTNTQLINLYRQVKQSPQDVLDEALKLQDKFNELENTEEKNELYYTVRSAYNRNVKADAETAESAAQFLFLNKAGFNGIYRVNGKGEFNVPSGHRKLLKICDKENLFKVAKALANVEIYNTDFEEVARKAGEGDFVFFDSPYHQTFDKYQASGFTEEDHKRLANLFRELTEKGVYCILTNSDTELMKELYGQYHLSVIDVKRMVNRDAKNRVGKEIVVTNFRRGEQAA